jgi:hypothetical protein
MRVFVAFFIKHVIKKKATSLCTSRHFKKLHIQKIFVELKRRKQVENLAIFKIKKII